MYVYIAVLTSMLNRHDYEVGFYDPRGNFIVESKHPTRCKAGNRVHFLNGGESMYIEEDGPRQ